jgi:hypothetical protein
VIVDIGRTVDLIVDIGRTVDLIVDIGRTVDWSRTLNPLQFSN